MVIGVLLIFSLVVSISVWLIKRGSDGDDSGVHSLGGDFTLMSAQGPVALHSYTNKSVLLFFGYTHCPDICPTTLANVASAMAMLGESERQRVQVLFVTLDPARDTPQHLAEYVSFFYAGFVGLGGSDEQIARVARQYQIEYHRSNDASVSGYSLTHTSYLFLLDSSGKILDMMGHQTPPDAIAAVLRTSLN